MSINIVMSINKKDASKAEKYKGKIPQPYTVFV